MSKKNAISITVVGILLMLAVTVAVSFAYWSITKVQETSNVITTGNLNVTISKEENAIVLENAYPISDEAAEGLTPFTFTITNDGDTYSSYTANLEMLAGTTLNSAFVSTKLGFNQIKKLNSLPDATKSNANSVGSKTLVSGGLEPGESVTYQLRLWIDKDVTLNDDVQNKLFEAKIVVVAQAATSPNTPQNANS